MSSANPSISPKAPNARGAQAERPIEGWRAMLPAALPFAIYALALAAVCAAFPYRPALDDNEWLFLAHSVAEHGQLSGDGVFSRVPMWQLLLGSTVGWAGDRAGVVGLQAAAAAGAFALLASRSGVPQPRERAVGLRSSTIVACIFALSPQLVLYSRHAATELWVGMFAMAVIALGEPSEKLDQRRAALLGALTGAATMTKLSAALLLLPVAVYAWRARARLGLLRGTVAIAAGFAAIVIPLVLLVALQRGLPLDDTSAFNLGPLEIEAWEAAGSSAERSARSLQGFWEGVNRDPFAYVAGTASRALQWFAWPSSLDLRIWIPEYPALAVELLDQGVFFGLLTFAALGTQWRNWPAWMLPLAFWLACAVGQKTPHSPKVAILFPLLLLAPRGLDVLRGHSR